jgi:2-polyprenyl-6-methoxyphenol hydroxylase-like FAD-dependent oxidoreductase
MVAAGVRLKGVRVMSGDKTRAVIDATRAKHRFNFMLSLPQSTTEAILTKRLAALGVRIERGCTVTAVMPGALGADAIVASASGEERVKADWIVGADGAHSMVRKSLCIAFPGAAYPFEWTLADVDLGDAEPDRGEILLEPHGPIVLRLPIGDGRHRILANGPDVLGYAPARWGVGAVHWQSSYRVSHRQVNQLGDGRVWLIGDAAHIHSPAGGRGMNLGIEDGVTLARCIAAGNLGTWAAERHAKATSVIEESDAMQRLATADSRMARWAVTSLLGVVTSVSTTHNLLVARLTGT